MKKYVENIRASVKKQGYVPTSDIIREAINTVCPDGENILENKSAIVDEVVRLLTLTPQIELVPETELKDTPPTQEPVKIQEVEPTSVHVIEPESQNIIIDSTDSADTTILQTESEQETESGIVVSSGEKHDLITSQASCLGIELSEVEVVDLATSIKDSFLDYESFVDDVVTAVVTYHDHRTDKLEQKIKDAREHIEYRRKQLNQTLVGEFGEMNNFFRQGAAKRRELSKVIASAFKT
ncbi:hypothetical protein NIES4071_108440 (plasmid) [Calothrix sp. NIES-4071]|nr:hypothetical protein NIES4071_108440 [Calothrix sp. NIES-4071]BAZ65144.1 hypothetical protein NIES4105_108770 [Calothrix sp. NIES-4105]